MRIVVLGGAGYIGSVLTAELTQHGHEVVVVDNLIYHADGLAPPPIEGRFVRADIRDEELLYKELPGADAVVHLGGLVGEPASAIDETLSVELNFSAPALAGEVAQALGIPRFVFLSTCSVYGQQEGLVTEATEPNPLSCYAWTKLAAERHLAEVLDDRTALVVLRLATVFGLSPRMRLDSVVNSMASRAAASGEIPLRGGSAWRPLVHVRDVATCIRRALEGDVFIEPGTPLILNVGNDTNNFTIAEIAEQASARVPASRVRVEGDVTDHRDYQVSFERMRELMPGACETSVVVGIDEIVAAIKNRALGDPTSVEYDNMRGLQAAIAAKRVAPLRSEAMRRLAKGYESRVGRFREDIAASYWGVTRLSGVPLGDVAAEDAAVLCQGKPLAISSAYDRWELDCLDSMLPDLQDRRVVDLGCGVGRIIRALAPRSREAVGIDIAPGMVARARKRIAACPNASVMVGSISAVPLPPASVDVAVCVGVFEHVPATYRERALSEISRVLRPGGELVLELNNAGSTLLSRAKDDNPHRIGQQLDNGYFCELVSVERTLACAEHYGLTVVGRMGNPFFSCVRHGGAGQEGEDLGRLFAHARDLDRALGHLPALETVADQQMIRMVKQ